MDTAVSAGPSAGARPRSTFAERRWASKSNPSGRSTRIHVYRPTRTRLGRGTSHASPRRSRPPIAGSTPSPPDRVDAPCVRSRADRAPRRRSGPGRRRRPPAGGRPGAPAPGRAPGPSWSGSVATAEAAASASAPERFGQRVGQACATRPSRCCTASRKATRPATRNTFEPQPRSDRSRSVQAPPNSDQPPPRPACVEARDSGQSRRASRSFARGAQDCSSSSASPAAVTRPRACRIGQGGGESVGAHGLGFTCQLLRPQDGQIAAAWSPDARERFEARGGPRWHESGRGQPARLRSCSGGGGCTSTARSWTRSITSSSQMESSSRRSRKRARWAGLGNVDVLDAGLAAHRRPVRGVRRLFDPETGLWRITVGLDGVPRGPRPAGRGPLRRWPRGVPVRRRDRRAAGEGPLRVERAVPADRPLGAVVPLPSSRCSAHELDATKVRSPTSPRVLDRRALNRTLLERQMLLRRRRVETLDAVERLVGMQAQVPRDPYVALWSRLDRFRPERLAEPLGDRLAVRMTLLRGTLHLVTADDALALRPLVQPVVERTLYGSSPLRTVAGERQRGGLLAMFEDLFAEGPRTRAQLVEAIAERWPERDASSLGYAMYLLPTVQVTPRGIWGPFRASFTASNGGSGGRAHHRTGRDDGAFRRVRPVHGGGRAVVVRG